MFPTPGLLAGLPMRSPAAVHGRAGRFCYDTMALVGPGSWEEIRGAADAALTAADLVRSGHRLAYALCRPPGNHATEGAYGDSCYLNNAAIAARALRAAGARRVAVIDIDAHHGNGTQMIFYGRADVWYGPAGTRQSQQRPILTVTCRRHESRSVPEDSPSPGFAIDTDSGHICPVLVEDRT